MPDDTPSPASAELTREAAESILRRLAAQVAPTAGKAGRSGLSPSLLIEERPAQPRSSTLPGAGPLVAADTFHGLIEAVPDALVVVGPDGHITLVNRQTERLFGYRRDELLGQPVEVLVPERFRERHIAE